MIGLTLAILFLIAAIAIYVTVRNPELANIRRIGVTVAGILSVVTAISSTYYTTDAGYNYVVENTLTGTIDVHTEPGVHMMIPGFTRITPYKQAATITFTNDAVADATEFTRTEPAVSIAFADTYTSDIPATFRFRLPQEPEKMIKLHKEFRTFENLVGAVLTKSAIDVIVITGTQYTGEEFFQGGVNEYKTQLVDQLQNGIYQTRREQVLVEETEVAPVSSTNSDANLLEQTTRKVWKNVILTDANGKPLRLSNSLGQYGVEASQVTIGRPIPGDKLDKLLENKRNLVAKRIAAVEQLQTAEAEAQAVQQEQEIEKRRQIQIAQREKEVASIQRQREIQAETQNAEKEKVMREKERALAVIDKQKELEIAEANRDIQAAAAQAAVFEATAIREKGLAEADVALAMLKAKQAAKDIYLAEMQRDIAQIMYPALANVKITMPQFYSNADGGAAPTSLDVFTTLGAQKMLEERSGETETLPVAK
jgi:hypothetical protein